MPKGQAAYGSTGDSEPDESLRERLKRFLVKPVDPSNTKSPVPARSQTVEELDHANRFADDKERIIGLIAAPVAAFIGILITGVQESNDPAKYLKNGQLNPAHTGTGIYTVLLLSFAVLSILMLAMAWYRKRLYLGIVMALYGLTIFNLHLWGFGIPYLMFGSWYLVRAYRAQKAWKAASGQTSRYAPGGASGSRPTPNKRYTPKAAPPKRSSSKPENEQKAG